MAAADVEVAGEQYDAGATDHSDGSTDDNDSAPTPRVELSPFTTIRCVKRGSGRTPPERCDRLKSLEGALADAIREYASLGPEHHAGAVVSVVMEVDFRKRRLKIYRGKSSNVPRSRTAELFRSLSAAMSRPTWSDIPHQHYKYVVNVKATYPPSLTL